MKKNYNGGVFILYKYLHYVLIKNKNSSCTKDLNLNSEYLLFLILCNIVHMYVFTAHGFT